MRQCGECSVCCYVGAVPELDKPAHTLCKYVKTNACGSCSIFKNKDLPTTCKNFMCSWRRGHGNEEDRPDRIGIMFSMNKVENQFWLVAIETVPNAISTTGKKMAIELVLSHNYPMIVVKHDARPPLDTGDYVIVTEKLLPRCQAIVGNEIEKFASGVMMYELRKAPRTFDYKVN